LTLTTPDGVSFLAETFSVIGATPGLQGKVTCESPCSGGSIVLDFVGGAFVLGQSLDYTIGVCRQEEGGCRRGAAERLLANGTYTYQFETDGVTNGAVVPFEIFQTTSSLLNIDDEIADLIADSQTPDPLFPSQILNPTTFVRFFSQPCTLGTSCPPLVLADADPAEDNPPVPEPSSLIIVLSALSLLTAACRVWRA
jgi:hypothetical protein